MAATAEDFQDLQAEITRMLAAALRTEEDHAADIERRIEAHLAETDRRDQLHLAEVDRRDVLHHDEKKRRHDTYERELDSIRAALDNRDLIGQAKGIVIASMGCTADEAFDLLRKQSQAENRKLHEVAADVVGTAQRRRR